MKQHEVFVTDIKKEEKQNYALSPNQECIDSSWFLNLLFSG